MFDPYRILVVVGAVAAVVLVALVLRRNSAGKSNITNRLRTLALQRSDYFIFIGIPTKSPTEWRRVADASDRALTLEDGATVSYSDVRAFAVAYSNGQLIDSETHDLSLPDGLTDLWESSRRDNDLLQIADLDVGRRYVRIEYGPSAIHPKDPNHYTTKLINISGEPVKIDRFAGYTQTNLGWRLSTVTREFFSSEEFREWYGLGAAEVILPGESATDPNNYGGRPVLWAYYCQAESGEHFIAGAILE